MSDEDATGRYRVTAANVDLSNCDKEQIDRPGLIQPHGVMLVLRPSDLVILQASENTASLLGIPASDLTLQPLPGLLGVDHGTDLPLAIAQAGNRLDGGPLHICQLPAKSGRVAFDVIAHRADDLLILELEQVRETPSQTFSSLSNIVECATHLRGAESLMGFLNLAVRQIHALSGFDRVMAYRFAEDGSGEVVAEMRRDGLSAYLGQHFPASDIPAPARRLFALNWLRHLPNVTYTPVRLLPETNEPVDMSRAILRHVSVMHTGYLKNMGAHATMVMPLMKSGRLWGLIACLHHTEPLYLPYRTRVAADIVATLVSSLMAEQEDRDTAAYRAVIKAAIEALSRQMARETDYQRGLIRGDVSLFGWLDASGAALVTEDGVVLLGKTPTESEVYEITEWLGRQDDFSGVFDTNRLPELFPRAEAFRGIASGLLAVRPTRNMEQFLLWFRPELVETIAWAGDPRKPVALNVVDGEARLTPRTSFELWKQDVQGRSAPWLDCELEAADTLQQVLREMELNRLNQQLRRSNTELDSFAYIASHDLKEPLRGIHNFAHFLKRSADPKLDEQERGRIETIIRLTRRMDDLTDALLQYSRIGQAELGLEAVDMNETLQNALEPLLHRIIETGTAVRVPRKLPTVQANRVQLIEVFGNLIVNALKYNDRPADQRWIEIGWHNEHGGNAYYVRDNGIGIAKQHLEHVFQIFRRLHGRDEYGGGNGAGLTIARRTVERLGGRLWAESDGLGKGTTFLFSLSRGVIDPTQP